MIVALGASLAVLAVLFAVYNAPHLPQTYGVCELQGIGVKVMLPSDKKYNSTRLDTFAAQMGAKEYIYPRLSPSAIVFPRSEEDVIKVIKFAAECEYYVSVKSGGHGYTGSASCFGTKCIQIDMEKMDDIEINDGVAKVESGVRLHNLINSLIFHKIFIPHGMCKYVGVGGHFQSSANGFGAHSFGSGMDYVTSLRLVMANGTAVTLTRTGPDVALYKAVLGSSPGSWGVVIHYTFEAIRDEDFPHTKLIYRKFPYSKSLLRKALGQIDFIAKDQEQRGLRDLFVIADYGHFPHLFDFLPDIPLLGPLSKYFDFEKDLNVYVGVIGLWTGIDSGEMTQNWTDLYIKPFDELADLSFPDAFDLPAPLSIATSPAMTFDTLGETYRRHLASIHTDHWWSDEFLDILTEEFDRKTKIPDTLLTVQYFPRGHSSQWYRNSGMNGINWRDTRPFMDDWFMFKNDSLAAHYALSIDEFYAKNRKHWQYSDGTTRRTFMSPPTTIPDSSNLRDPRTAQHFFANASEFRALRVLKTAVDPKGMFASVGTIPCL